MGFDKTMPSRKKTIFTLVDICWEYILQEDEFDFQKNIFAWLLLLIQS